MSLTTFLANKDVRARFSEEFPKPKFGLKKEILAPPVTKRYSLVGTAFDYLMRFCVKQLNPKATTKKWVAESSTERMRELGFALNYQRVRIPIDDNLLAKADKMLSQSKKAYSDYIKSGNMNDEVTKCTILLAQLDTYFRAGIIGEDFGIIDEGDVADLQKLIAIVRPDSFKAKELYLLNPKFGEASLLVGGADADLVIDNLLIDIKTTTKLEFKIEHFNELLGYYTLYKLGGIPYSPIEPKIENLGIYYSRYGELYTFPVAGVISSAKFPSFIEWFTERASQENEMI
jgi:hypothetical protein